MFKKIQFQTQADRHKLNNIVCNRVTAHYIPRLDSKTITVKDTPQLSDLKGPGTSKLDWRYFEYNRIDRNEPQVRIYLHKGTGTKMTDKLTNLTEKK